MPKKTLAYAVEKIVNIRLNFSGVRFITLFSVPEAVGFYKYTFEFEESLNVIVDKKTQTVVGVNFIVFEYPYAASPHESGGPQNKSILSNGEKCLRLLLK